LTPTRRSFKGRRLARSLPRFGDELADLAPRYEFDVVLLEQPSELFARHVVEVALTPSRAPRRVVARDGAHLLVVVGEVDYEQRDAGPQALQEVGVELRPALGPYGLRDGDDAVERDAVGGERTGEP